MTNVIDFNISRSQHRCFRNPLHSMPQRGSNSGQKFADTERLVDEIVCTEVEHLDLLGLTISRREHDDRYVLTISVTFNHIAAVAVGQPEIEDHNIRAVGSDELDRTLRRFRR